MNSYKLEGIVTALSPVTQTGDQKTGATSMLPYKDVWYQGDNVQVPYISGNSIRGRLRRLVMADLCDVLGFSFKNEHVWHAFFGGGQLQSIGPAGVIDLKFRKDITGLIPPVALWGFSLGNQVLESKMIVQDMDVLCEEMREYMPARFQGTCTESFHRFVSESMFTRKDDKQDGTRKDDDSPAIQMKVGVQVLIPGTRFYHGFILRRYPSPVEVACLHHAIRLWNELPTIGGKSSTGFGRLKLDYEVDVNDAIYLEHLVTRKDEIIAFLSKLDSDFGVKAIKKPARKKAQPAGEAGDGQGELEKWVEPDQ